MPVIDALTGFHKIPTDSHMMLTRSHTILVDSHMMLTVSHNSC